MSESEKERVGVNLFVEIEEELGCGSLAIEIEFSVFLFAGVWRWLQNEAEGRFERKRKGFLKLVYGFWGFCSSGSLLCGCGRLMHLILHK